MRERKSVDANGITISYLVDGPVEAPVVVLVHGNGGSADNWATVMDGLAPDHRVYAMDLRGHGSSTWPGEYSLKLFAEDVRRFPEALGLSDVVLVGHSLGGMAAMLAAQEAPSWLARLVLEDAPMPRPGWMRREMPPRPEQLTNDWDALAPALVEQLNNPDPVWWERLGEITVPTLSLAGGSESHVPQENLILAAERITQGRVRSISVGHLIHDNAPEQFLREVRAFLAETTPL